MRLHRSRTLGSHDVTHHRGTRVTAPIRTLLDVARTLEGRRLERVLDRVEPLIDFAELRHRLPGSPSLQAVLSSYTVGSTKTRSELEEAFLRLCDDHGLPRPNATPSSRE